MIWFGKETYKKFFFIIVKTYLYFITSIEGTDFVWSKNIQLKIFLENLEFVFH